jgi:hypothetical protein
MFVCFGPAKILQVILNVCIFVQQSFKQCWGSVTFWRGSGTGSADPYLWLMDPDLTPFFSDFKDAKKNYFYHFFLQLTRRHIIFSLKYLNFLLKFCVKILLQVLLQSAQRLYVKRKGSGAGSIPLTNGSGSGGGPKTRGSGSGSGSLTLLEVIVVLK